MQITPGLSPSLAVPGPAGPAPSGLPAWLPELAALEPLWTGGGGDLGEILGAEERRGLEKVLGQLEQRGARFAKPAGGFFGGREPKALAARQVLPALAECRPHYLDGLQLQVPGHPPLEDLSLGQLAAAAQWVLGPRDLLKDALAGIAAQGYSADPLKAYSEALGRGGLSIQFERGGNLETYVTQGVDEVLAVNALAGDGSTAGVARPDRARRLLAAVAAGWLARGEALFAYRKAGGRVPLQVAPKLPPLLVKEESLDDPAALAGVARRYQEAYDRYVLPAVRKAEYGSSFAFHEELHVPEGRASLEARLESFGALLQHAPHVGDQALQDLHQELCRRFPESLDLVAAAHRVAPALRDGGVARARKAVEELGRVGPSPRSALFEELRQATGSHEAARGGVDLVRVPVVQVGPDGVAAVEPLDSKVQVYRGLAQAMPEQDRALTPEVYLQLLIHRRPEQPLAQAAGHLRTLLAGCAASGFPMLAPALYEALQTSPPEDVEQRVASFGKHVAAGDDLAGSLDALEAVEAGEIHVEADQVTIGGIVIPRRG